MLLRYRWKSIHEELVAEEKTNEQLKNMLTDIAMCKTEYQYRTLIRNWQNTDNMEGAD